VNGQVDHANRALLTINVAASRHDESQEIVVWVDTAFNGDLVLPYQEIERLQLPQASSARAILADGQTVELETFECLVEWFGESRPVEVVANEGQLPLLGTSLLTGRVLTIDYQQQTLQLL
jgi:clan AA aspartic protease